MKKMVILQTVTPDYRKKFFMYLKKELKDNFALYGGDCSFEKSVVNDDSIIFKKPIKNYFFINRNFLFQKGMWSVVTNNNVLILELNPRIISSWIILIIRKIYRRKTILWGHAWPRAGANSKSDSIRNIMRILGTEIIVYTNTQQKELQRKMPHKKIWAAPNAIFFIDEMITEQNYNLIKNIIYVGRLTKNKKPFLLIKAFHQTIKNLPKDANLIIIGDGEERVSIETYIKKNELSNRIKILGHIEDYNRLKKLYDTSLVSVSPGYVGLSVTQSFGFGVAMIVSKNEPHSPEIEAVIEEENAMFFKTDNIESLSQQIINFYNKKEHWIDKRVSICNYCKENYSLESMAKSFLNT